MVKNKSIITISSVVVALLCIPLIAMQFTNEVNWSIMDFMVMGILLFSTGILLDFIFKKVKRSNFRLAYGFIAIAIFLLIWAELAVGIFGSPLAGS